MEVSLSREFLERCIEVYLVDPEILSMDILEVLGEYSLFTMVYRDLFVPTFIVNMQRKAIPGSYRGTAQEAIETTVHRLADELENDGTNYFKDIKVERKESKI